MRTDILDEMMNDPRMRFVMMRPQEAYDLALLCPRQCAERLPIDLDFPVHRIQGRYAGQYRGLPVFVWCATVTDIR